MYREPIVMGRKPGLKSMLWSTTKKQTFNCNRIKKQEFKKNEERLRNIWEKFEHSNI